MRAKMFSTNSSRRARRSGVSARCTPIRSSAAVTAAMAAAEWSVSNRSRSKRCRSKATRIEESRIIPMGHAAVGRFVGFRRRRRRIAHRVRDDRCATGAGIRSGHPSVFGRLERGRFGLRVHQTESRVLIGRCGGPRPQRPSKCERRLQSLLLFRSCRLAALAQLVGLVPNFQFNVFGKQLKGSCLQFPRQDERRAPLPLVRDHPAGARRGKPFYSNVLRPDPAWSRANDQMGSLEGLLVCLVRACVPGFRQIGLEK
jgi:hypothetical protein